MNNGSEPAYPQLRSCKKDKKHELYWQSGGLTKREMFAKAALHGWGHHGSRHPDDIVSDCVAIADALLAELARTEEGDET